MKIVVSRYNEDIQWTYPFPNVIIYNKGAPLNELNVIPFANVGREGHTYYKYIVDHYDELDDTTAFLQGNPFDHSPNIIQALWDYMYEVKQCNGFVFLSKDICLTNCKKCPYWDKIPMKNVYSYLFGNSPERIRRDQQNSWNVQFGAGAQFIVSRERILAKPREYYQKVVELLEYSSDPIEGHAIERYHSLIFA